MTSLVSLDACLGQALRGLEKVPARPVPVGLAVGGVLAEQLVFPQDCPGTAQALREGLAVAALDLMGASAQMPLETHPVPVVPGQDMPAGTDAILHPGDIDLATTPPQALRAPQPGEGVRLAGHDARRGAPMAQAGQIVTARLALVAELAGLAELALRCPRVAITLRDPVLARYAAAFVQAHGATIDDHRPDMVLRDTDTNQPRLALMPGETAWLSRRDGVLVLDLPPRFDGMLAALLALGLPALRALTGQDVNTVPVTLARKLVSAIGMTELALLIPDMQGWIPETAGTARLSAIARAGAFVLVAPEIEGYPAGATLTALPLETRFAQV
jgi:molybdopterin molybdotransferase